MANKIEAMVAMVESNGRLNFLKFIVNIRPFNLIMSNTLRILLTLPVTAASGERSFFKL